MASELSELKTYFGRCRCCFGYGYLKNMWKKYTWQGETEVYGEMLTQCFALSWEQQDSEVHDQICDPCVLRLRDAVDFKQLVVKSQMELMREIENDADESTFQIKIEDETIIKAEVVELNNEHDMSGGNSEDEISMVEPEEVYAEPSVVPRDDPVFEEVEYLEDESGPDGALAPGKDPPYKYALTRRYIFDLWVSKFRCPLTDRCKYVMETLSRAMPHVNTEHNHFKKRIRELCISIGNYWKQYGRSKNRFLTRCHKWLQMTELFEISKVKVESATNSNGKTSAASKIDRQTPNKEAKKIKSKPHIKKPLNAFMLYMKFMRPTITAEDKIPLYSGSAAAVNQILGRRWQALEHEEKAKYYEMARHERQRHRHLYPNWKPTNVRKKKKTVPKEPPKNGLRKCRARYGLDKYSLWCAPCKRKKKCVRHMEALAATRICPRPITVPNSPEPCVDVEVKSEVDSDASSDVDARLNSRSLIDFEKNVICDYFTFTEPSALN